MQDPGFQGRGQSPALPINRADGIRLRRPGPGTQALALKLLKEAPRCPHEKTAVAGTLQVASQVADAREAWEER